MKVYKQINNQNNKLLLFFCGWSASPLLFRDLEVDEVTDLWIVYDYQTLSFDESVSGYQKIDLIAWSMGVWAADYLLHQGLLSHVVFTATALNGTPYPISDTFGIPEAIFLGTLENLTDENLRRFNRRMCGSREKLVTYEQAAPSRPLIEVRNELNAIYQAQKTTPNDTPSAFINSSSFWTHAIICTDDLIFPATHQRTYWQDRCPVTELAAPHYPFYLWKHWNEIWKQ